MINNKLPCWLKYINDNRSVTELSIPGTHDAMTALCDSAYYKTQHLSLIEQLNIGVRFFDLRITRDLVAAHREWVSDISAQVIFEQLQQFLAQNPSEFVLVRIQNANEKKMISSNTNQLFKPLLLTILIIFIYQNSMIMVIFMYGQHWVKQEGRLLQLNVLHLYGRYLHWGISLGHIIGMKITISYCKIIGMGLRLKRKYRTSMHYYYPCRITAIN